VYCKGEHIPDKLQEKMTNGSAANRLSTQT